MNIGQVTTNLTVTNDIVKAMELAKACMPGSRQGRPGDPKRAAWEHPHDLVKLLEWEYPGKVSEGTKVVAWLHDILEDGVRLDADDRSVSITVSYLRQQGFRASIVNDICALTKGEHEDKLAYLSRLKNAPHSSPRVKIVKCADRICNLREGVILFKDKRWVRYVGETYYFLLPLADSLKSYEGEWLREEMVKAAQLRPVK